jgi:cell wall-associated NlpC family hydrolase
VASDKGTADLLERLLRDPGFRAAFRADPGRALREAGLTGMAKRVGPVGPRKALETLEIRESRSSLAGAMMAGVLEGVGVVGADEAAAAQPAPAPASPASSLSPDDIVDVAEHRNVAAQAVVESDGPDGGDGDHGDGSGEDPAGDENERDEDEPDESESDENESDEGDDGSDDDQDAPGEGSNGEDANDSASDGDSSDDGSDSSDDGSDSSEDDDDSDSSDNGSDSSDGDDSGGDSPVGPLEAGDYPGDDASQVELARWMGAEAQKRGLPPELPVMAALTESKLQNLDGGDRDSVGFFQMRLGIWNRDEYAGYPSNPAKQIDWFLDQAEAIGTQRKARGLPVDDPNRYGDWIADIERPAAEYRGRYQLNYEKAHELVESAGKGRGDGGGVEELVDAAAGGLRPGPRALAALAEARDEMGVPYKWGGSSPSTGFDCSGLVQWAYAKVGIRLPRVTDQQILAPGGTRVDRDHLLPGDLVFFRDSTGYVHHVGISLGGDKFINAPHSGAQVRIDSLDTPYWAKEFTGGRRFDTAVAVAAQRAQAAVAAGPPPVDDRAVRVAQAALERDAAQAGTPGTAIFRALERQERGKNEQVQFLPAVNRTA